MDQICLLSCFTFVFVNWRKKLDLLKSLLSREDRRLTQYKEMTKAWPEVRLQEDIQLVGAISNIRIGEHAKVNKEAYLNVGGKSYGGEGSITIGKHTIIGSKTTLYAGGGQIAIGDYCDIGVGALLLAHSRKSSFDPSNPNVERMFDHTEIKIGKCCNIASGAIVLGGTTLGDYCIVAAGAVVQGKYETGTTLSSSGARAIPRILEDEGN